MSTYARLKIYDKLASTSLQCVKEDKARGLSHEALAFSYIKLKKTPKAIEILTKEANRLKTDRIYSSLARLYLEQKNIDKASKFYLKAFHSSRTKWLFAHQALKEPLLETYKPLLFNLSDLFIKEKFTYLNFQNYFKKTFEK